MRTVYGLLWLAWVAAFVAIEATAIATGHNQYTLSDFIWRAEEINRAWTALRVAVAVFCVWLFLHLVFGLFR